MVVKFARKATNIGMARNVSNVNESGRASQTDIEIDTDHKNSSAKSHKKLKMIPKEFIKVEANVRTEQSPERLQELIESIKSVGLLNPLTVKEDPDSNAMILIAGHRRLAALMQIDEIQTVPVMIDDGTYTTAKQLVENLQREDMTLVDTSEAIIDLMKKEDISEKETATLIGKDYRYVHRLIKIAELPEALKDLCRQELLRDTMLAESIVEFLKKNPKDREWIIKEIIKRTFPEDDTEDDRRMLFSRSSLTQIKKQLKAKQNRRAVRTSNLWTEPITMENINLYRREKECEHFQFNGLKYRQTCTFLPTDAYIRENEGTHVGMRIGENDDPSVAPQLTNLSVNPSFVDEITDISYKNQLIGKRLAVIEYRSQFWVVPVEWVTLTGIEPLPKKGKEQKQDEEK